MSKDLSLRFLRISLGVFFVILGTIGVLPNVQESVFSLNDRRYAVEALFGIVEIACGIILIAGLFTFVRRKTIRWASLAVLVFWGIRIVVTQFVFNLRIASGIFFLPTIASWFLVLACELVILAAVFAVYRAHE